MKNIPRARDLPQAKAPGWEWAWSLGLEISLIVAEEVHWGTQGDMSLQMKWFWITGHLGNVLNLSPGPPGFSFWHFQLPGARWQSRPLKPYPVLKSKTLSTVAPASGGSPCSLAEIRHPAHLLLIGLAAELLIFLPWSILVSLFPPFYFSQCHCVSFIKCKIQKGIKTHDFIMFDTYRGLGWSLGMIFCLIH